MNVCGSACADNVVIKLVKWQRSIGRDIMQFECTIELHCAASNTDATREV